MKDAIKLIGYAVQTFGDLKEFQLHKRNLAKGLDVTKALLEDPEVKAEVASPVPAQAPLTNGEPPEKRRRRRLRPTLRELDYLNIPSSLADWFEQDDVHPAQHEWERAKAHEWFAEFQSFVTTQPQPAEWYESADPLADLDLWLHFVERKMEDKSQNQEDDKNKDDAKFDKDLGFNRTIGLESSAVLLLSLESWVFALALHLISNLVTYKQLHKVMKYLFFCNFGRTHLPTQTTSQCHCLRLVVCQRRGLDH